MRRRGGCFIILNMRRIGTTQRLGYLLRSLGTPWLCATGLTASMRVRRMFMLKRLLIYRILYGLGRLRLMCSCVPPRGVVIW